MHRQAITKIHVVIRAMKKIKLFLGLSEDANLELGHPYVSRNCKGGGGWGGGGRQEEQRPWTKGGLGFQRSRKACVLGPGRQGVHVKKGTRGLIELFTSGNGVSCPEDRDDSISIVYEVSFFSFWRVGWESSMDRDVSE
jgi:hypothetical protein